MNKWDFGSTKITLDYFLFIIFSNFYHVLTSINHESFLIFEVGHAGKNLTTAALEVPRLWLKLWFYSSLLFQLC